MNTIEIIPGAFEQTTNDRKTGRLTRVAAKAALPILAMSSMVTVSACEGKPDLPASPNTVLVDRPLWDMSKKVCPGMNRDDFIDWVDKYNDSIQSENMDEIPLGAPIVVPACSPLPADD
ncbi:MAG: hypothetical protein NTX80_02855 [Candidatus Saccharibacteria bacterium]|nr:hypothetical protein [Candidatus Saccharibacteria bacterium]